MQRATLAGLGFEAGHLYIDTGFTGKTVTRDGLTSVPTALRAGDELVVPGMGRLARHAREVLRVVEALTKAGATLICGGSVYEPGSPASRLLRTVLAEVAEAEACWISIRVQEAVAGTNFRVTSTAPAHADRRGRQAHRRTGPSVRYRPASDLPGDRSAPGPRGAGRIRRRGRRVSSLGPCPAGKRTVPSGRVLGSARRVPVGGGRQNRGMAQLPTLGSWLSTLDEGQLTDVIDGSPLAQAGSRLRSVDELAQRLSHPASVASTLCEVPLPVLEIVEAASALGEAASVTALADLLDTAGSEPDVHAQRVVHWLVSAQRAALLWVDGERLRINPGVDAMVTEPLTIGRPARMLLAAQNSDDLARILKARHITTPARKAERLVAALAAFSDPSALRRVAARAPEQVLQTLTDHVSRRLSRVRCQTRSLLLGGDVDPVDDGIAYYVDGMLDHDAYQRERDRGEWVKAAGLATGFGGWSYHYEADMPSEVFLALAPPSFRAPFHADPPSITLAPIAREQVQAGSAAALAHVVAAAMTIFEEVARGGLQALKRGGVGTRELARLAKHVREDIPTVRLALELGLSLELFGLRDDGRIGVSPQFDPWRRRPPHQQAFDLVSQWLLLEYVPTAEQDESGTALPAVGRDDLRTGVPNGLLLIATIASATQPGDTPGAGAAAVEDTAARDGVTSDEEVLDFLVWNHPTVRAVESAFAHTWTEARLLGVVVDGVVAPFAEEIVAGNEAAALAILEQALPAHSAGAMFGSDLTVVVPGNPAPDVVDVLTIVADREGHGAANIWRVSEASVRSALDTGYAAADLVDALRGIGGGAVPQTWEYLIADTARKHGRLRVTGAAAVITCQDEALLAEAVASRALRTLGLSLAAPTVAISRVAPVETLRRLREAGFLPVEVDADGAPVVALRSVPRAAETSDAADVPQQEEAVPQQEAPPAQAPVQDEGDVIPLFADDVIASPRRGDTAESARELAARLLSGNPDSNPRPGEVNDIADVERHIAHFNRRLSPAEVHELADAETRVRSVIIRYRSQSGRESVRMVSQLNLVGDNLFAFCHLRDEERVFRLDRIIEVAPTY